MRFPVKLNHRGRKAKIYAPGDKFPYYRLAYADAGKRMMKTFAAYSDALKEGKRVVRDLAKGSQAPSLTAKQSRDALAALQTLESHYQATGERFSLNRVVQDHVEIVKRLKGRTPGEAIDGYLANVATVKRKDIGEAVTEFVKAKEPLTKADEGKRAQLSGKYFYNLKLQLDYFADTFANTAICDLTKDHLTAFISSLDDLSPKSRNHYRAAVRQFLQWATLKDYLSLNHRLNEADGMKQEIGDTEEIEFYTAKEFRALLETAEGTMRAMIAIGGLAGLRTAEILRLTWENVWRVEGHIELTKVKSKNRQRRLVEVCPALSEWLNDFRQSSGKVCTIEAKSVDVIWQQQFLALCERAELTRKRNGLRHAFCTYHFALHSNENLTAAQSGNSPAMLHRNYKGLATKAESEKWFNVRPAKSANIIPLHSTAP